MGLGCCCFFRCVNAALVLCKSNLILYFALGTVLLSTALSRMYIFGLLCLLNDWPDMEYLEYCQILQVQRKMASISPLCERVKLLLDFPSLQLPEMHPHTVFTCLKWRCSDRFLSKICFKYLICSVFLLIIIASLLYN